jgi:5'-nucleotidase
MEEGKRGTILITNDDGIDAPGLRALVDSLVNTNLFNLFVCAPDSEKSAVSHSITWLHPIAAKQVHIHGTVASFAVSGSLLSLSLSFRFSHAQPQVSTAFSSFRYSG